jgi:twitching motility two-component system response regulator PilH
MSRAKTILLADPDLESAKYATLVLENEGFRVVTTRDGDETLQKIRTATPHLVLLEIPMPSKNGYQVCRAIKEDEVLRTLPVVFLSAKAQPSDRFWAKRVGANGFVAKPFDPADLLREIHGLLDGGEPAPPSKPPRAAPARRRRSSKSTGGGD